jgi:circadian clock protein KaiA
VTSAPPFSICSLVTDPELITKLRSVLVADRYHWQAFEHEGDFAEFIQQKKEIHCLILESKAGITDLLTDFYKEMLLLPAVILVPNRTGTETQIEPEQAFYHVAEVQADPSGIDQINHLIETAIQTFLQALAASPLPFLAQAVRLHPEIAGALKAQQQELSRKLKERLGYFGIYYKRDPHLYFRHMSSADKQALLTEIKTEYREIVLEYFNASAEINAKIDALVTKAFFADLSVSQILEIHMELMDTFAKQLKLEGRSEDVLLDYRLTLIDVIAHLCEMYRRSLPREV